LGRLWLSGVAAGAAGTAPCMRLRRTGAVAPRLLAACCRNAGRHNAASTGVPAAQGGQWLELYARTHRFLRTVSVRSGLPKKCAAEEPAYGKTLASKLGTRMQPFEYPSVSYWSKEINGTLP
jgi:hypothetical protein